MEDRVTFTKCWYWEEDGEQRMRTAPWQSECPEDIDQYSPDNPYLYTAEEKNADPHGDSDDEGWMIVASADPDYIWFGLDFDTDEGHINSIPFSLDDVMVNLRDVTVVKTKSGGRHIHMFIRADNIPEYVGTTVQGIDLLGHLETAQEKHIAASPWDDERYEILAEGFADVTGPFSSGLINEQITVRDYSRNLLTFDQQEARENLADIEVPDEPPEELPQVIQKMLTVRMSADPEQGESRHWANTYIGYLMLHLGYSIEEIHSVMEEYPDDDGYDPSVTQPHLERFHDQIHNQAYAPPSPRKVEDRVGIQVDYEQYPFYNNGLDLTDFVPSEFYDEPYADVTPHTHMTVTSSARAGKSTLQTKAAADIVRDDDSKKFLQVVGKHTDGLEQLEKWHRQGIRPVYLCGRRKAKEMGCPTGDQNFTSADVRTPEDCKNHSNLNTVTALEQRANDNDIQVVITVPHKIDALNLEDFTNFMSSEEDPLKYFFADSVNLLKCTQVRGTDRSIESHPVNIQGKIQDFLDEMDSRDQLDKEWNQLITAARALDDIANLIKDWSPGNWSQVKDGKDKIYNRIEIRLHQMAFEEPPDKGALWTRVQNQGILNEIGEMLLSTVFWRKIQRYPDGQKIQFHLVSDWDQLYGPDMSHMTFWLSGNDLPFLQMFHSMAHGNVPEPRGYRGTHAGIKQMRIIRYRGGDNPNQQSRAVQDTIEQIQNTRPTSNLVIAGSSDYTAKLAQSIPRSWRPTSQDTVADLRAMASPGSSTITAENSSHSEGIDTGFFGMGALYNGRFATPVEDAMAEEMEDDKFVIAEWIRAAQNAALRPANTRDDNTGVTPVIVPDRHVPEEMFAMLEEYGIEVVEAETVEEMRTMVVEYLKMDMEGVTVEDGRITRRTRSDDVNAFELLRRQQTSSSGETH